jgi:prepilin-type processing-associated H-X9-DG protein
MITDKGGDSTSNVRDNRAGFGRIDLLAVMVAVAILGSLTLSASSTAKTTAHAVQCLENCDQLIRAWTQYAQCNGGWLPPNQDDDALGNWLSGDMSYPGYPAGFNTPTNYGVLVNTFASPSAPKTESAIGGYLNDYKICRCPADESTGAWGGLRGAAAQVPRVRSYSMSQAVGTHDIRRSAVDGPWLNGSYGANSAGNGPYLTFGRLDSFTRPGPASTFVIADEDPYSINDAAIATVMNFPAHWVDYPASYHNNGCAFAFADAHVELHRWKVAPVLNGVLQTRPGSAGDIEWFQRVTTAKKNGTPIPADGGNNSF